MTKHACRMTSGQATHYLYAGTDREPGHTPPTACAASMRWRGDWRDEDEIVDLAGELHARDDTDDGAGRVADEAVDALVVEQHVVEQRLELLYEEIGVVSHPDSLAHRPAVAEKVVTEHVIPAPPEPSSYSLVD
eukprot:2808676-Pleurochrysis_carterae.AAC.3